MCLGDIRLDGELNMPVGAERLREPDRGVPNRCIVRRGVEFAYLPGLIGSVLHDASVAAISNTFRRFLLGVSICSSEPARGRGAAPRVISA
jgi:hypothetical protein